MLKGISAVTIGQSHIDNGTDCQDCAQLDLENKNYVMAAVADGHGSKKHFRSDRGSQFAAQAAKDSIYEYMNDYERFVDAYQVDKEYLIDRIVKMTITKWHEKIREDLNEDPITQEEIDKYLGGVFNSDKVSSVYGTTLLVGVMSEKCNFGFLIGDGSFVVIDKHGKAYIPIEDTNSKANYTSSLSSSDSYNGFVTHFFDEMPFSIMVSTDGLVKSFANDSDFLDYNQAIAMELGKLDDDEKIIQMEERLIKLFEQRSRDGSEDDISISIIFDIDAYDGVIEGLQTRRKLNKIDEQIDLSKKKINTLNFKMKQIISERKANRENLVKINDERRKLEDYNRKLVERKQRLEEELRKIEQESDELNKKKIELDLEFEKYEKIDQMKEQEKNKNLEDQELEKENIEIKEKEKEKLQDLLNS
ncbi:MAG: protein phosphatase 2C domain-containing protein [Intestinibacter sp.]|uniref:protein phosphatase 2C domain-containing protein n=2 Tax=Intestinibacter sp. TaxID=1965304 RepID=UPI002A7FC911|nr:protein phosphatase 2C domain-containing protein [Intestinibacter sp.]MDY4574460.1 protein phosphatase 2C domain-containing protein [Intestinibacter sp.]